jgi:hypothetical protein
VVTQHICEDPCCVKRPRPNRRPLGMRTPYEQQEGFQALVTFTERTSQMPKVRQHSAELESPIELRIFHTPAERGPEVFSFPFQAPDPRRVLRPSVQVRSGPLAEGQEVHAELQ